jgi:NNP family nitrate/nitrite transporter-like MFS transporter
LSANRIDRTIQNFFPFPLLPLFLLVGIFYVNFVSRVTIAPLLSVIKTDLGLGMTGAGSLFFWTAAGYCVGLFASGFVTGRLSYRRTILLSAGLMGAVMLALSVATSLALLFGALFLPVSLRVFTFLPGLPF